MLGFLTWLILLVALLVSVALFLFSTYMLMQLVFFVDGTTWERNRQIALLVQRHNKGQLLPHEREEIESLIRSGLVERRGLMYGPGEKTGSTVLYAQVRLSDQALDDVWR